MTPPPVPPQPHIIVRQRRQEPRRHRHARSGPEPRVLERDHAAREVVVDEILDGLHRGHRDEAHARGRPGRGGPGQPVRAESEEERLEEQGGEKACCHCFGGRSLLGMCTSHYIRWGQGIDITVHFIELSNHLPLYYIIHKGSWIGLTGHRHDHPHPQLRPVCLQQPHAREVARGAADEAARGVDGRSFPRVSAGPEAAAEGACLA